MTKHTIMFLAANPKGTDHLALDQEAHSIHVELERSSWGNHFEFVTRFAAEPLDLIRELRKLRPTVVQFSGHGGRTADARQRPAPHRDVHGLCPDDPDHCAGLYFQGADGAARVVTGTALRDAFAAAGSSVKLVVLNACYSELAAEALLAHVDCVVGMSGSIGDEAARAFAVGFYGGLGECESVAAAYNAGCAAISLEGLRESDRPRLKGRRGIDPGTLILSALEPAPPSRLVADRQPGGIGGGSPRLTTDAHISLQFGRLRFEALVPSGWLSGIWPWPRFDSTNMDIAEKVKIGSPIFLSICAPGDTAMAVHHYAPGDKAPRLVPLDRAERRGESVVVQVPMPGPIGEHRFDLVAHWNH